MELKEYLQQHHTPRTVQSYEREIGIFLSNYPQASEARYKDILNYLASLRTRYSNARTLFRILASIKVYYSYLCYIGKRKDHPAKGIYLKDKVNRSIQLQDLLSEEELENMLDYKKERMELLAHRNKIIISLLIYQALLPLEIAALTVEDINLEKARMYIKEGAKLNSRTLALKPRQIILFYEYLQQVRPQLLHMSKTRNRTPLIKSDYSTQLIVSHIGTGMKAEDITKHVKRVYKGMFGDRKVNAMVIRQSVISNLLKRGNDLTVVQLFAGHKTPGTTEKYKHSQTEELQQAILQHHPIQ